jgi:hypothetical protein
MSEGDPTPWSDPIGPFRADQIHDGDRYELCNGHAIHCMTAGNRHSAANAVGVSVLASDPAVKNAGADAGIAFNDDKNLRAPDIALNIDPDNPGWSREAPPLAVEYASVGQDWAELKRKVAELLEFGTRYIWVVHLVGPLRVDIHEPGRPVRTVPGDATLTAPGVLHNPVPVRALVDPGSAREVIFNNLLNRQGYANLDAIRDEARDEARDELLNVARERLRTQLAARGWSLAPDLQDRVAACADIDVLMQWLLATATAESAEAALRGPAAR